MDLQNFQNSDADHENALDQGPVLIELAESPHQWVDDDVLDYPPLNLEPDQYPLDRDTESSLYPAPNLLDQLPAVFEGGLHVGADLFPWATEVLLDPINSIPENVLDLGPSLLGAAPDRLQGPHDVGTDSVPSLLQVLGDPVHCHTNGFFDLVPILDNQDHNDN